jgi:tetratricopeptide (TPR) repeat protein
LNQAGIADAMTSHKHQYQDEIRALVDLIDLAPDARDRLRGLIATLDDVPARLRVMGHVLLDLELTDLALEAFGRALLIDDLDGATHLGLVRTYLKKGARNRAMAHLDIAISLRPEARELRVLAADVLCAGHQMGRALDHLGAVLAADPAHSGARRGLAGLIKSAIVERTKSASPIPAITNQWAAQPAVLDPGADPKDWRDANRRENEATGPILVWGRQDQESGATDGGFESGSLQHWYPIKPDHPAIH